jgi:hypothetical protein
VQIAAASLWLKGKSLCPEIEPEQLNLVAPNLRLADLPDDDPALVELRSDIESETGITGDFTRQILQALQGADHLGSLLKIDEAVDAAIKQQEHRLKALQANALQVQADLFGGDPPVQAEMDFSAAEARADLQELLEQFLSRHTSANDLGLRLQGEQLAAGVQFVRLLKEDSYHLVAANPPYQDTGKMKSAAYINRHYAPGKPNLYSCFLQRGLDSLKPGGLSAMLTMRNWLFLKQFSDLREYLLQQSTLVGIGDFDRGAFEGIPDEVVSVCASVLRLQPQRIHSFSQAHCPTPRDDVSRDSERTARKRAATLSQEGLYRFRTDDLGVVPERPLVYWWSQDFLREYSSLPRLGNTSPARKGVCTSNNTWFIRRPWEAGFYPGSLAGSDKPSASTWSPYIMGAEGISWIEPIRNLIEWRKNGLAVKVLNEKIYGSYTRTVQNQDYYFKPGVAFSTIGSNFSGRLHRYPSIFDTAACSVFPDDPASIACLLNSTYSRDILSSLNPTINFTSGDVNKLPLSNILNSEEIVQVLIRAHDVHSSRQEKRIEFISPGPSPWGNAQRWAQLAVDRPEEDQLSEYTEELDPEPPIDHLSFALGVALGRFAPVDEQGQPITSNQPGILGPAAADLSHALHAGILFLDGSLEENDQRDDLGTAAAAPLHQAWSCHGSAIASNRGLRDWLRLDFFKDVHKGMYENRPIHWPLSSAKRTFVAWVNIHRMNSQTLKILLADHLIHGARSRIEGELADLREVRDSEDRQAARKADARIGKLTFWLNELNEFISAVEQCADHGALPTDGRCPEREQDAVYAPDLDDGVMINSAALWPLL